LAKFFAGFSVLLKPAFFDIGDPQPFVLAALSPYAHRKNTVISPQIHRDFTVKTPYDHRKITVKTRCCHGENTVRAW
jgi:hypothetical protein